MKILWYNLIMNKVLYKLMQYFSPFDSLINPLPTYQEEMKLILLGTGDPFSSPHRSKAANLILAGDKTFLIDCGTDTVKQMLKAHVPVERIDGVFFTHQHADHNSGFIDLLITASHFRQEKVHRQGALKVYGPTNTKEIISKIITANSWDINLRLAQGGKEVQSFDVEFIEKNEGTIYNADGLKVTAFLVDHGVVKPAIGYRFEYKGKIIVISGDTKPCANLLNNYQNADILLHEAYSKNWIKKVTKYLPAFAEKINISLEYHSSTLEVAEIAQKAQVKHLVFTHLMPTPTPFFFFENNWAKGVSKIFHGKVTVGRDLMKF